MPAQYWSAVLNDAPGTAGAAYNTSVTLTDVTPAPQFFLPANFLAVGSVLEVEAAGVFSTTATPTLLLGVYYGAVAGTALIVSAATTTASGVTNIPWRIRMTGAVRTTGTSGTMKTSGGLYLATTGALATLIPLSNTTPQTAVTVDTTVAKAITIGAQWGTNSASNTLTLHEFYVTSLR